VNLHTYAVIQGCELLTKALVFVTFGASILAQQHRAGVRLRGPRPGGVVGGLFFAVMALVPLHMALGRFGLLPWEILSWQGTVFYGVVSGCATATIVRWWRKGFGDAQGPG
jgi:hypothetical protein